MKSLAMLFQDLRQHLARDASSEAERGGDQPSAYLELGQQVAGPHGRRRADTPTHEDVLNYLGQLADDYRLPRRLVYAVANAESSMNVNLVHQNGSHDRHGHERRDRREHPLIRSTDYGVMQINSSNIGRQVDDAHGHRFVIGQDVRTDWRANARAGVALLAPAYRLAELEQGHGANEEDHAQQAYSQYNTGNPRLRDRYLRQRSDGMPRNGADRNFLEKYRSLE